MEENPEEIFSPVSASVESGPELHIFEIVRRGKLSPVKRGLTLNKKVEAKRKKVEIKREESEDSEEEEEEEEIGSEDLAYDLWPDQPTSHGGSSTTARGMYI